MAILQQKAATCALRVSRLVQHLRLAYQGKYQVEKTTLEAPEPSNRGYFWPCGLIMYVAWRRVWTVLCFAVAQESFKFINSVEHDITPRNCAGRRHSAHLIGRLPKCSHLSIVRQANKYPVTDSWTVNELLRGAPDYDPSRQSTLGSNRRTEALARLPAYPVSLVVDGWMTAVQVRQPRDGGGSRPKTRHVGIMTHW